MSTPGLFRSGYADDGLSCERSRDERPALSVLGVRVSLNRPPVPVELLDPNESLRIAKIRFLKSQGTPVQLSPVSTLKCGQLLNRILGVLFRSDSIHLPAEVRYLFRFGE